MPHAESYTVYKNNKPVAEKIKETKYIDNVAPGKFYEYHVRAWDLYDLEDLSQIEKNKNHPINFQR